MSFEVLQLDARLTENLVKLGYRHPRPIQARGIPPILEGRDLIGLAHTGTGKTAAYVAGLAHRLLAMNAQRSNSAPERGAAARRSRLRALVICPTRELAAQGADEASRIVRGRSLRVACVYGKVGLRPQVEAIDKGVDILFGTPGRLRELAEEANISYAFVRMLVLDEADRLLDMGFQPQVRWLIERMPNLEQRLLFSATMAPPVERLAREYLTDPVRLEVDREAATVEHVRQSLVRCGDRAKLGHVLDHVQSALRPARKNGMIIFCRTRRRVGWVGAALRRHSIRAADVHGDRTPAQRRRALEDFEAGGLDVLVATDVAARGLHIERIRTVINYDLPLDPREYVHRIGRAGHGGHPGAAITFLSAPDTERWERVVKTVEPEISAQQDLRTRPASDDPGQRHDDRKERGSSTRGSTRTGGRTSTSGKAAARGASKSGPRPTRRADRGGASASSPAKSGPRRKGAAPKQRSAPPHASDLDHETTRHQPRKHTGDKPRSGRRQASSPIKPGTKPGGGVRRPR